MNKNLSRRSFIELGCKIGAWALFTSLAGCSGGQVLFSPNRRFLALPPSKDGGSTVLGIYESRNMREICEETIPKVSDMKWLSRGDSIFVKVACNSPKDHPAVTCPQAIGGIVGFLKDRGAGTIYVGDQSGVQYVRLTRTGRKASTQAMMKKNGILNSIKESGASIHCFDDQGWNGYHKAEPDFDSKWEGGIWLPKIIEKVDHIIYLPKLGAHGVAGYTCGIKNAVGWLRDDSRLQLHQKGQTFFEKIAEINYFPSIRNKLRFTLTLVHSVLLNIGPEIGGKYDFDGCLVLASRRLIDHDYLASILLPWFDKHDVSFFDLYSPYPDHVNFWNRKLVKDIWGKEALKHYQPITAYSLSKNMEYDICISHLGWLEGYRPEKIVVQKQGNRLPKDLVDYLKKAGGGIFSGTRGGVSI